MKKRIFACVAIAIVLVGMQAGCRCDGPNQLANNNQKSRSNNGEKNENAGRSTNGNNNSPDTDTTESDEALILSTEREVLLKPKGAAAFVPILKNVPFHPGDVLRVGDAAKAIVFCRDVCELGTGEYVKCCIPVCRTVINIHPTGSTPRTEVLMRKDLPPEQAIAFNEQESRIERLELSDTSKQFLKANLYSWWKLKEASNELQTLTEKLDKPEAKHELKQVYAPIMRKTGDLFVEVNQKERALDRYQKTIELPPDTTANTDSAIKEKAAAHTRIAEIYAEKGNKNEAVANLDTAKRMYVRTGETQKAAEADRKMAKIKQP